MDEKTREIVHCLKSVSVFARAKKNPHTFNKGVKDITIAQLNLLAYLYEHKKAKMSELAKYADVKLPSMTDTINRLVAMGILKREHDEKDRRTVWVHITKDVEKMVGKHIREKDEEISGIMSILSHEEKEQALKILKKIKKHIERAN
jgi:DNA-binding MarR family transcriptional regulator